MDRNKKIRRTAVVFAVLILAAILTAILHFGSGHEERSLRVGLILTGAVSEHGWNGQHYKGLAEVCRKRGAELLVEEYVPEHSAACLHAMQRLVRQGARLVILASYGYSEDTIAFIREHPEISFYAISPEYKEKNLSSYFCRAYQARYLAGMLAGLRTKTGRIGYVASMPNSEVNRGLSAFTLGVRRVNPSAVVTVAWTRSWDERGRAARLTRRLIADCGVDLVTYHQNSSSVAEAADASGVPCIGYNEAVNGLSDRYLATVTVRWNEIYDTILQNFLQGKANSEARVWFGMEHDAVSFDITSPLVAKEERDIIEAAREDILRGKAIFSGEIHDIHGQKRCSEGEAIGDWRLMQHFDWYADGIEFYDQ